MSQNDGYIIRERKKKKKFRGQELCELEVDDLQALVDILPPTPKSAARSVGLPVLVH